MVFQSGKYGQAKRVNTPSSSMPSSSSSGEVPYTIDPETGKRIYPSKYKYKNVAGREGSKITSVTFEEGQVKEGATVYVPEGSAPAVEIKAKEQPSTKIPYKETITPSAKPTTPLLDMTPGTGVTFRTQTIPVSIYDPINKTTTEATYEKKTPQIAQKPFIFQTQLMPEMREESIKYGYEEDKKGTVFFKTYERYGQYYSGEKVGEVSLAYDRQQSAYSARLERELTKIQASKKDPFSKFVLGAYTQSSMNVKQSAQTVGIGATTGILYTAARQKAIIPFSRWIAKKTGLTFVSPAASLLVTTGEVSAGTVIVGKEYYSALKKSRVKGEYQEARFGAELAQPLLSFAGFGLGGGIEAKAISSSYKYSLEKQYFKYKTTVDEYTTSYSTTEKGNLLPTPAPERSGRFIIKSADQKFQLAGFQEPGKTTSIFTIKNGGKIIRGRTIERGDIRITTFFEKGKGKYTINSQGVKPIAKPTAKFIEKIKPTNIELQGYPSIKEYPKIIEDSTIIRSRETKDIFIASSGKTRGVFERTEIKATYDYFKIKPGSYKEGKYINRDIMDYEGGLVYQERYYPIKEYNIEGVLSFSEGQKLTAKTKVLSYKEGITLGKDVAVKEEAFNISQFKPPRAERSTKTETLTYIEGGFFIRQQKLTGNFKPLINRIKSTKLEYRQSKLLTSRKGSLMSEFENVYKIEREPKTKIKARKSPLSETNISDLGVTNIKAITSKIKLKSARGTSLILGTAKLTEMGSRKVQRQTTQLSTKQISINLKKLKPKLNYKMETLPQTQMTTAKRGRTVLIIKPVIEQPKTKFEFTMPIINIPKPDDFQFGGFPAGGFMPRGYETTRPIKRSYRYTPSLVAAEFRIKGSRTSLGSVSGLGVRPI